MIRIFSIFCFCFLSLQAASATCSSCTIGKDMAKCDYYVKKNHNLKYQSNCLNYAKSIDRDGMYAKASWYYLLGGDKDATKKSATEALKIGHNYAAEYIGFVYILNNDIDNAKKELQFFKHKVKNIDYVKSDIETLTFIYKDFDKKVAYDILF